MDDKLKNKIYKFLDYYYDDYNDETMFEIALKTLPYFPIPFLDLVDIIVVWGDSKQVNIVKTLWKIG